MLNLAYFVKQNIIRDEIRLKCRKLADVWLGIKKPAFKLEYYFFLHLFMFLKMKKAFVYL